MVLKAPEAGTGPGNLFDLPLLQVCDFGHLAFLRVFLCFQHDGFDGTIRVPHRLLCSRLRESSPVGVEVVARHLIHILSEIRGEKIKTKLSIN